MADHTNPAEEDRQMAEPAKSENITFFTDIDVADFEPEPPQQNRNGAAVRNFIPIRFKLRTPRGKVHGHAPGGKVIIALPAMCTSFQVPERVSTFTKNSVASVLNGLTRHRVTLTLDCPFPGGEEEWSFPYDRYLDVNAVTLFLEALCKHIARMFFERVINKMTDDEKRKEYPATFAEFYEKHWTKIVTKKNDHVPTFTTKVPIWEANMKHSEEVFDALPQTGDEDKVYLARRSYNVPDDSEHPPPSFFGHMEGRFWDHEGNYVPTGTFPGICSKTYICPLITVPYIYQNNKSYGVSINLYGGRFAEEVRIPRPLLPLKGPFPLLDDDEYTKLKSSFSLTHKGSFEVRVKERKRFDEMPAELPQELLLPTELDAEQMVDKLHALLEKLGPDVISTEPRPIAKKKDTTDARDIEVEEEEIDESCITMDVSRGKNKKKRTSPGNSETNVSDDDDDDSGDDLSTLTPEELRRMAKRLRMEVKNKD